MSERLPDDNRCVFVTCVVPDGRRYVVEDVFYDNDIQSFTKWDDYNQEPYEICWVVAWMEYPEPYKD